MAVAFTLALVSLTAARYREENNSSLYLSRSFLSLARSFLFSWPGRISAARREQGPGACAKGSSCGCFRVGSTSKARRLQLLEGVPYLSILVAGQDFVSRSEVQSMTLAMATTEQAGSLRAS